MTTIFDQIKADREAGSPAEWITEKAFGEEDEMLYWTIEDNSADEYRGSIATVFSAEHIGGITRSERDANARRIARVPQLERIALAAEGFAALAEVMMKDLVEHGGYTFEDDFKDELAALNAFREASA